MVYLLVVLHSSDLGETATTELAAIRLLSGVASHVPLQTGCFKEAFSTIAAEVGSFVVMLLSVQNGGIPIGELSSTILTLVDLAHAVAARSCQKKSQILRSFSYLDKCCFRSLVVAKLFSQNWHCQGLCLL